MGFFKSMAGMMTVEMICADVGHSLNRVIDSGIPVFDAKTDEELCVRFQIYRRHYKKVQRLAEKYGDQLRILRKTGIYWLGTNLVKRPLFVIGMLLVLILALWVPNRIFFVQVEGAESVPARMILETADSCGIGFGAMRREVRSEKMKNALLEAIPELQWAGVNTYGCTAVITVRERQIQTEAESKTGVSSIAAQRDGVILSCTVTKGNGLCSPGQAVKKGEILISGYTDCGLSISATRAEGEILAQTRRSVEAIMPSDIKVRGEACAEEVHYTIQIGKKYLNLLKDSGISEGSCVKMYSKYVLTLPGGFELPVALIKETVLSCSVEAGEVRGEAASVELSAFAEDFLQAQMNDGKILDSRISISSSEGAYILVGQFDCAEQIGVEQTEEIGEYHGKTDGANR